MEGINARNEASERYGKLAELFLVNHNIGDRLTRTELDKFFLGQEQYEPGEPLNQARHRNLSGINNAGSHMRPAFAIVWNKERRLYEVLSSDDHYDSRLPQKLVAKRIQGALKEYTSLVNRRSRNNELNAVEIMVAEYSKAMLEADYLRQQATTQLLQNVAKIENPELAKAFIPRLENDDANTDIHGSEGTPGGSQECMDRGSESDSGEDR